MTNPHCQYCIKFEPVFKELEQKLEAMDPEMSIGHIDLLKNDELHERFDVRHLPTLALFKGTKLLGRFFGHNKASEIIEWLDD